MKAKHRRIPGLLAITSIVLVLSLAGCTTTDTSSGDTTATTAATTMTAAVTTTASPNTPLTAQQLTDVTAVLNDPENNGFICTTYDRVQDINLYIALYEMKGGSTELDLSKKSTELSDLESATNTSLNSPGRVLKYPLADLNAFLIKEIGISVSDTMSNTDTTGFIYMEKYDAYYLVRGDDYTAMTVTVTDSYINADGQYIISYTGENGYDYHGPGTVTLLKTSDGYQFVSNVKS